MTDKSKFDPLLGRLREDDTQNVNAGGGGVTNTTIIEGGGGGSAEILQYNTTDPAAPAAHDAWVLRTTVPGAGGGSPIGLLLSLTKAGASSYAYTFKYRTEEATTISVAMT